MHQPVEEFPIPIRHLNYEHPQCPELYPFEYARWQAMLVAAKANDPPLVYLCGGINGCTDSEANNWRDFAKANLKCGTLDPMRRDYRGRQFQPGIPAEIVGGDTEDIARSLVVLAYCHKPSWGTAMEIRMAKAELRKPVVGVVPPDSINSPWLIHHCDIIFEYLAHAVAYINELPDVSGASQSDRGEARFGSLTVAV